MSIHVCLHSWVQELELIKMLVEEDQAQLFAAWPAPGTRKPCLRTAAPALQRPHLPGGQHKKSETKWPCMHHTGSAPCLCWQLQESRLVHFTSRLCCA